MVESAVGFHGNTKCASIEVLLVKPHLWTPAGQSVTLTQPMYDKHIPSVQHMHAIITLINEDIMYKGLVCDGVALGGGKE